MGPEGPVLTAAFARTLKLDAQTTDAVNAALQAGYQKYLQIELLNRRTQENELGHVVTTIAPSAPDFERLEDELLTQLDELLDVNQQRIVRLNLELQPPDMHRGNVSDLVHPGVLGWGNRLVTVETWRVGSWYHWKIIAGGPTSEGRAPEPPAIYSRFWIDEASLTTGAASAEETEPP